MAGMPPLMAQAPTDTRMPQCLRNCLSTWTLCSFAQPPSTSPTSTKQSNSFLSSSGDLSRSTRASSSTIRSSISSNDMWHPKQPAREQVASLGFAMAFLLCRRPESDCLRHSLGLRSSLAAHALRLDVATDRSLIELAAAIGRAVAGALDDNAADGADMNRLIGSGD